MIATSKIKVYATARASGYVCQLCSQDYDPMVIVANLDRVVVFEDGREVCRTTLCLCPDCAYRLQSQLNRELRR